MLHNRNQESQKSSKDKIAFSEVFKPYNKIKTDLLEEKGQCNLDRTEFNRWGKLKGILFTIKALLSGTYPQERFRNLSCSCPLYKSVSLRSARKPRRTQSQQLDVAEIDAGVIYQIFSLRENTEVSALCCFQGQ